MRKILFCGMVIFIWDSSAPPVRPGKQRCVFDCKWTRLDIEWERQKDRKTKRHKRTKIINQSIMFFVFLSNDLQQISKLGSGKYA